MYKILIVAIVAVLGAGMFWFAPAGPHVETPAEKAASYAKQYRETYFAQFSFARYKIGPVLTIDGPLEGIIGIDATGGQHELVPVRRVSTTGDWTLYYSFKPGTDAGAWPYFAFNRQTGQLKILSETTAYIETGYPDIKRVSPDGRFVLSVWSPEEPHEGTLYSIDWVNDEIESIHALAVDETYVEDKGSTTGAIGGADVAWINDTSIRYGVFARSPNLVDTRLRTEILDLSTGEVTVVK
jgi:hypothetical protein